MRVLLLACALLVLLGSGCSSGPPQRVPLGPPQEQEQAEVLQERDEFDLIVEAMPLESAPGTRYYARDDAPRCPDVRLRDGAGNLARVQPYTEGCATIVVYWHVEAKRGVMALVHADRLARKYRRFGVDGIGIVQKTRFGPRAPEVAEAWDVTLPLYYDDVSMEALEELADAADAEAWSAVPAFFITDGGGRIRFYRPGFTYSIVPGGLEDPQDQKLLENAPEGQTIEDYLKRILSEG